MAIIRKPLLPFKGRFGPMVFYRLPCGLICRDLKPLFTTYAEIWYIKADNKLEESENKASIQLKSAGESRR